MAKAAEPAKSANCSSVNLDSVMIPDLEESKAGFQRSFKASSALALEASVILERFKFVEFLIVPLRMASNSYSEAKFSEAKDPIPLEFLELKEAAAAF
ncbi:hypothetical protein WICPIJ_004289 [Wickerhamomyces pijperi]|uniref:Uncharacterized protein n=1 Tax=Wickerhamomyces pijperi TaxID=599730 RepID=A0A9P8Q5Y1_WICPI|nr:hypothetical protein WICPIJ_004289 [Wickerhamomyces pijperi]